MIKIWNKSVWLGLVAMSICFRAFSYNVSDELIRQGNQLLGEYKDYEALQKFEEVLTLNARHYQALHKISLLHSRIGARFSDELQKTEHFTLAKTYAERALRVNHLGADANYVMALAINNLSFVSGARARIAALKEIKSYLDVALAADPQHASAWQLLGRWHFKVANFNVLECTLSKVLNGCAKEQASNIVAVSCLQKAIAFDPNNLNHYYDLAVVFNTNKKKEQSIGVLHQALNLQPVTSEDLELSRRCKALLAQISSS